MKEVGIHVSRMVRAGSRFADAFEKELNELSQKATLIAEGKATGADKKRVEAIREKLEIAYPIDEISNRADWLAELNATVEKLRDLSGDIGSALKKAKKKKSAK